VLIVEGMKSVMENLYFNYLEECRIFTSKGATDVQNHRFADNVTTISYISTLSEVRHKYKYSKNNDGKCCCGKLILVEEVWDDTQ
jgi:uncharacterized protein with ParB-like and HNH nuclease domain